MPRAAGVGYIKRRTAAFGEINGRLQGTSTKSYIISQTEGVLYCLISTTV